ncbi:NO-inducible flavohemoprotein [Paenibacillus marinisediminis]
MLSEKTIQIIKSTVPVLEVHGQAITKRFYQMMFTNHPELLNVFNHANQKQGRQQAALANAVYAAAAHIDNLEAILPAVKQIGHKHRSLGIKAESYPIVGENLLAAIKDVLGDAATDEIINAWAEAYGVISDAFISVEAEMYNQAEQQEGGWSDFRAFTVAKKVKESDVITSFYLVPQDGKAVASFSPGQYVTVKINIPGEEYTFNRQYSLSDAPGKPYYRISVKREDTNPDLPAGKVSVYLHDSIQENDTMMLSAPAGDFTLHQSDDQEVVLISGGVGLTPMISMLNTLVEHQPQRSVKYIHSAINSSVHAMKEHVDALARQHQQLSVYTCYERPTEHDVFGTDYHKEGFIDQNWLQSIISSTDAKFYFTGPRPFMKAVYQALLAINVPAEKIHFEFFGPAGSLLD